MQAALRALLHYTLLAAAATMLLLPALMVENPAHGDTTRDLCMARDCATDEVCPMAGADTSYPGIRQSGLWPVHLAALQHLGLGVEGVRRVAVALIVAALLAIALIGEALATRSAGFAAALIGAVLHLQVGYWEVLWNPIFILLPCAAFFGAIAIAAYSRHWLPFLAASFFLAVAMALHPVAFLIAIALPWALVLRAPANPWRTLLGMIGVAGVTAYTFSRDAMVALYREVETGAMSDSLSERAEQVIPTVGLVVGGVLLIAALATFWWLQRTHRGPLGRWLQGPVLPLLIACLTPFALALVVLLATNRFYVNRYLVAPMPGLLIALALGLGWLEKRLSSAALARRLPRSVGAWAGPLLIIGGTLLMPGLHPGGSSLPPWTWTYADGEALADHLIARDIAGFSCALDQIHGIDLPLLMYALRPYLAESCDNEPHPDAPLTMVVSATPDEELPREWLVRLRADGSAIYAAPAPRAVEWQSAELRLLSGEEDGAEVPWQAVEVGGIPSTYAPWVRPLDGEFATNAQVLQLRLWLLPITEPTYIRPFPDCRCPAGEAAVMAVDGLEARLFDGMALIQPADRGARGRVTLEWRAAASCPPISIDQGGPSVAAWPAASHSLDLLMRRSRCPQ